MLNFKVKVYLSPTKEIRSIDGVHFVAYLTRWTFAETDHRTTHWRNTEGETDPVSFNSYQQAQYVDGSKWSLSEIDSCIGLEDIEIVGKYEVFSRDVYAFPIYDTKPIGYRGNGPSPDFYTSADVTEHFPLANLWDGAVIDGREYRIDEVTGGLKSTTVGKAKQGPHPESTKSDGSVLAVVFSHKEGNATAEIRTIQSREMITI
jgi:hypothetical protein